MRSLFKKLLFFTISFCVGVSAGAHAPRMIQLIPTDIEERYKKQTENIDDRCPWEENRTAEVVKKWTECRDKNLQRQGPTIIEIDVYEEPHLKSKKLGKIVLKIDARWNYEITYMYGESKEEFPPDSKGTDYSYGHFYEYTVSDIRGDWIQLPKRPFSQKVWINLKHEWGKAAPSPSELPIESPLTSPLGDIVIVRFDKKDFLYREEKDFDLNCGEATDEYFQSKDEVNKNLKKKEIKSLYDSDGHLVAQVKYTRGC